MMMRCGVHGFVPVERIEFEPGSQAVVIYTGKSRVWVRGEAAVRLRARLEQDCIDLAQLNDVPPGPEKNREGNLDVA